MIMQVILWVPLAVVGCAVFAVLRAVDRDGLHPRLQRVARGRLRAARRSGGWNRRPPATATGVASPGVAGSFSSPG